MAAASSSEPNPLPSFHNPRGLGFKLSTAVSRGHAFRLSLHFLQICILSRRLQRQVLDLLEEEKKAMRTFPQDSKRPDYKESRAAQLLKWSKQRGRGLDALLKDVKDIIRVIVEENQPGSCFRELAPIPFGPDLNKPQDLSKENEVLDFVSLLPLPSSQNLLDASPEEQKEWQSSHRGPTTVILTDKDTREPIVLHPVALIGSKLTALCVDKYNALEQYAEFVAKEFKILVLFSHSLIRTALAIAVCRLRWIRGMDSRRRSALESLSLCEGRESVSQLASELKQCDPEGLCGMKFRPNNLSVWGARTADYSRGEPFATVLRGNQHGQVKTTAIDSAVALAADPGANEDKFRRNLSAEHGARLEFKPDAEGKRQ